MSWPDEKIAHPMGYEYAQMFPRARDAIAAYVEVTGKKLDLPSNVCAILKPYVQKFVEVDGETGLASLPVHLYGYRADHGPADLTLDPHLTGWGLKPQTPSCIVSFGRKKFYDACFGGAFLTSDLSLANEIGKFSHWPFAEGDDEPRAIQIFLANSGKLRRGMFEKIDAWDAALGDLLLRIPGEQIVPWRIMRTTLIGHRNHLLRGLRARGIPVTTGYKSLTIANVWEWESICFFPLDDPIRAKQAIEEIWSKL